MPMAPPSQNMLNGKTAKSSRIPSMPLQQFPPFPMGPSFSPMPQVMPSFDDNLPSFPTPPVPPIPPEDMPIYPPPFMPHFMPVPPALPSPLPEGRFMSMPFKPFPISQPPPIAKQPELEDDVPMLNTDKCGEAPPSALASLHPPVMAQHVWFQHKIFIEFFFFVFSFFLFYVVTDNAFVTRYCLILFPS